MVKSLSHFLTPFKDFHLWSGTKQVDYLAYYLQAIRKLTSLSKKDIDKMYDEIPLRSYGRTSAYLSEEAAKRGGNYIKRKPTGYVLSKHRFDELDAVLSQEPRKVAISASLLDLKARLTDQAESDFLGEAISCFENDTKRAAIVTMWALVIAHLRNKVLSSKLSDFNKEVVSRNARTKEKLPTIATYDDFGEISESKFIELLKQCGAINKEKKMILEEKLKIRNMAAHPTSTKIGAPKVTEFIDDLVNNILT